MNSLLLYHSFEGIIAFFTIIGNSITLIAILKYNHLHTVTNVFIGHLAAADILNGLVASLAIVLSLNLDISFHTCLFINSVFILSADISIIMLICVTCERYIAIRYPFKYIVILDTSRANYIAFTAWVLGFIAGLLIPMFWQPDVESYGTKCRFMAIISYSYLTYIRFGALFLLPICLMMLVYGYIGNVARRHRRLTDELFTRLNIKLKRSARTTQYFILLIAVLFVLQLPLHLLNFMKFFDVTPVWISTNRPTLILIAVLLSRSNSMVNVIIYAGSNYFIKEAMLHLTLGRPMKKTRFSSYLTSHMSPTFRSEVNQNPTNTATNVSQQSSVESSNLSSVYSSNITEKSSPCTSDRLDVGFINFISK